MPAAHCESDDFQSLNRELERIVHDLLEQAHPGAVADGIRIETASVI